MSIVFILFAYEYYVYMNHSLTISIKLGDRIILRIEWKIWKILLCQPMYVKFC